MQKNRRVVIAVFSLIFLSFIVTNCGGGSNSAPPTPPTPPSTKLTLSPVTPSVAAGLTLQLTASQTPPGASAQDVTTTATWRSSNTSVATIDSAGLVTGKGQGTTTITASTSAASASVSLTVTPAILSSISVSVASPAIPLGLTDQLTATGTFSDGSTKDVSTSVSWSSSNTRVVTVDVTGLATGKGQGDSTITASSGNISGDGLISVEAPALTSISVTFPASIVIGTPQQAQATGNFTDGSQSVITSSVAWSSSKPFVASVDSGGGVTAQSSGMDSIVATSASIKGSANFVVLATPRFAFTASRHEDGVGVYTIDPTTLRLRNLGYHWLGANVRPWGLAVHPFKPCVYVVNALGNDISQLSVGGDGKLTEIMGSPVTVSANPVALAVDPSGRFLYVVSGAGSDSVSAFAIDAITGALSPIAGSLVSVGSSPTAIAIDPEDRFAYVANGLSNTISTFSIDDSSGVLTAVGPAVNTTAGPQAVLVDPTGNYLFVAGNQIQSYKISQTTGTLTVASVQESGLVAESLSVDPEGKFLYAGNLIDGDVYAYSIAPSSGALTSVPGSPFPAANNPVGISFDPTGQLLYVMDAGLSRILTFKFDSQNGALTLITQARSLDDVTGFAVTGGAHSLTYTPQYAYVANSTDNTISAYTIGSDGQLTPSASPFSSAPLNGATTLATDLFGNYLFATGGVSSPLVDFQINSGGSLSNASQAAMPTPAAFPEQVVAEPSSRFLYLANNNKFVSSFNFNVDTGIITPKIATQTSTGTSNPVALAIDPSGIFLYVADFSSGLIYSYTIFGDDGSLNANAVPTAPAGTNPTAIIIDPAGRFLYVANFGSGDVSSFQISNAGNLTQIGSSTTPSGLRPVALAIDGTGKYLYIANQGDGTVAGFSIDPSSGALTALSGSPFTGVTNASAVSTDINGQYLYVTSSTGNTVTTFNIDPNSGALASLGSPVATGTQPRAIVTTGSIQ